MLQTTSGDYELLYWDASTGQQLVMSANQRDVEWARWTCILGWPCRGVWPEGADGTDINVCVRSHSGNLLATTDDFGEVKLFKYPCYIDKSQFRVGTGHSSHVT